MKIVQTQLNRRSFLRVSTATTGGLLLGFNSLVACTTATETELASPPEEWFDINAFIKIGNNGDVSIIAPNPEIGQNVKTSMPMIVAEELDVNWQDVTVEQAPFSNENFGNQIAGGSQSIRRNWEALRMAGATARNMLMQAASGKWGLPVSDLYTKEGVVYSKDNKLSASYGELAELAALLDAPTEVALKDPKDFKIIGQRVKNVDAQKIATGQPLFGLDTDEKNMLIAMIVHAPGFGQTLISMNAEKAKSMPGIKDIFPIHAKRKDAKWHDTNSFPDLIAVVGETTWQVMKAKKALELSWSDPSGLESSEDHEKLMTDALANKEGNVRHNDGDVDAVFKNSENVIERVFTLPFLAHNAMEPMNFYANVTADKAELIGPIQTPGPMRESVATVLGMPLENVDVMMTRMGGGFGRRLYGHFGSEAAVISQKVGAPVKLIYSREDDMTNGVYRPPGKIRYRAALNKDNELAAFYVKGTGIPNDPVPGQRRFPAGTVENFKIEKVRNSTSISTGAWRAPGSCITAPAEQSFIDELAEIAGKDPIDFRLELFRNAIEKPVGERNDYDAKRFINVINTLREKSGWDTEMPGVYRGFSAYYSHNTHVAFGAQLTAVESSILKAHSIRWKAASLTVLGMQCTAVCHLKMANLSNKTSTTIASFVTTKRL